MMIERLEKLGFEIETLSFGEVTNLWARRGRSGPLFCFAGHTDVVPTGPEEAWKYPPFSATVDGDMLHGRGAADMKGSVAAMLAATERFLNRNDTLNGSMAFLITSDEEGDAVDGTVKVVETLEARGEKIDWCLVGEPSSEERVGDTVKNGRRGSLGGRLLVHGTQGHVAYPHLARNPVHDLAPALAELTTQEWDQGNDFFPPTSFQISNVQAGTGATNVIPGTIEVLFNIRYSSETDDKQLKDQVTAVLNRHDLKFDLEWNLSGRPFLTETGKLLDVAQDAITRITGHPTRLSTSGGTSDGRFIAPTGAQVIELGPINATIHKVNECVSVSELDILSTIYEEILNDLLGPGSSD